jgi:hypothetical protein
MIEWIPVIAIFALFVWIAQYNSIAWFFVGFVLLLLGAIVLPPPWKDFARYILFAVMAVWTIGALFDGGGGTGGNDRGGFRDDDGGG